MVTPNDTGPVDSYRPPDDAAGAPAPPRCRALPYLCRLFGVGFGLLPVAVYLYPGRRPWFSVEVCVTVVFALIGYAAGTALDRLRGRPESLLARPLGRACLLALVALVTYSSLRGWTPARTGWAVYRDVPAGADLRTVEAFLDGRGWPREHATDPVSLRYYGEYVGLGPDELSGILFGEVTDPNLGLWGLNQGSITVLFYFGPDGRLVRYYLRAGIVSL